MGYPKPAANMTLVSHTSLNLRLGITSVISVALATHAGQVEVVDRVVEGPNQTQESSPAFVTLVALRIMDCFQFR